LSKRVDYKAYLLANLRASPVKSAILGVAVVVLIVLLGRQALSGPNIADADQDVGIAEGLESTGQAPASTIQRLPKPRIDAVIRRDPFRASWLVLDAPAATNVDPAEPGALQLQATLTNGATEEHCAMVSGVMVHVGDKLEGYRVLSISNRSVELAGRGQRITLTMGRSSGADP